MQCNFKMLFCGALIATSSATWAVPPVTGEPVVMKHYGSFPWPQDEPTSIPYLTQTSANDVNDLHGQMRCDLNITTAGNYHAALREAMKGSTDFGYAGIESELKNLLGNDFTVCWTTSPPIANAHIPAGKIQFKNISVVGVPALAMGPGDLMNQLVTNGYVDQSNRSAFLRNRGNVILKRADATNVKNVCDLGKKGVRVVTPHPSMEGGSFRNFSGSIYNVAAQNEQFGCQDTAEDVFNAIFSQDLSELDLDKLNNPFDMKEMVKFYHNEKPKWLVSSRIMHRDIPYALCHDMADAGVIFYHLATYVKSVAAGAGCELVIEPMGGTEADPMPLPGNQVGTIFVGKVNGTFSAEALTARDYVYNFLVSSPIWTQIADKWDLDDPTP